MSEPEATTIRTQCRFCGEEIWAQSDNGEPECVDCAAIAFYADLDLYEIEQTLHPLTEWQQREAA